MTQQVPRKILVVDDDAAVRALVSEMLFDAGFVCLTAGSGREALQLLDAELEIGVVVSDVMMPGLDGIRLGRFMRTRFPERPWLQVVFITAHPELELAVSALRLGAVDYLTKPVDPDELASSVGRAMAASRAVAGQVPPPAEPVAQTTDVPARREPPAEPGSAAARSTLDHLAALRRLKQDSRVLRELDEPSWVILLEAYRAEISGRRLSVSKLCTIDESSQTTAWRRIRAMEEAGLLVRDQDPGDARRAFLMLTQAANDAISDFMSRADALVTSQGTV